MFVNNTVYSGVSAPFTREITRLFSSFPRLKISTSSNTKSDAIVLGIINSPKRYATAMQTTATKFTAGELEESTGNRSQFYVPTASSYRVDIRVIMIKNPTTEDIRLLSSKVGGLVKNHPKVVFNQAFFYTGNFNRESKDTITSDSGGIVNYSKTKRYFEQTLDGLAVQAARDLEDLVINVF